MRFVAIDSETASIIAQVVQLRANPDDHLFQAPEGGPVDQAKLNRIFCDAERALNIPVRGLYSAKDTVSSFYLSNGGRLDWLSE